LSPQASTLGYLGAPGDAGSVAAVFEHSRVGQAKALVVTTEDTDRKLAITLMAHSRNPNLKIAVTGADNSRAALLNHAGASDVVIPDDLICAALVDRLGKGGHA
jgi:voltage-gated potassium channel